MTDHDLPDRHVGPLGEARRVAPERLRASLEGDAVATLDYWWLHLPGQAIVVAHAGEEPKDIDAVRALEVLVPEPGKGMDTFAMGVITLRDIPGVPPARKAWPWVTHELLVHTVDTQEGPVPFEAPFPWRFMQPHNVSAQFQVDDDDMARHLLNDVARGIVHGLLPPEVQAYVPERGKMMTLAPLHNLWQETVTTTAEHLRTRGTHQEAHP